MLCTDWAYARAYVRMKSLFQQISFGVALLWIFKTGFFAFEYYMYEFMSFIIWQIHASLWVSHGFIIIPKDFHGSRKQPKHFIIPFQRRSDFRVSEREFTFINIWLENIENGKSNWWKSEKDQFVSLSERFKWDWGAHTSWHIAHTLCNFVASEYSHLTVRFWHEWLSEHE